MPSPPAALATDGSSVAGLVAVPEAPQPAAPMTSATAAVASRVMRLVMAVSLPVALKKT